MSRKTQCANRSISKQDKSHVKEAGHDDKAESLQDDNTQDILTDISEVETQELSSLSVTRPRSGYIYPSGNKSDEHKEERIATKNADTKTHSRHQESPLPENTASELSSTSSKGMQPAVHTLQQKEYCKEVQMDERKRCQEKPENNTLPAAADEYRAENNDTVLNPQTKPAHFAKADPKEKLCLPTRDTYEALNQLKFHLKGSSVKESIQLRLRELGRSKKRQKICKNVKIPKPKLQGNEKYGAKKWSTLNEVWMTTFSKATCATSHTDQSIHTDEENSVISTYTSHSTNGQTASTTKKTVPQSAAPGEKIINIPRLNAIKNISSQQKWTDVIPGTVTITKVPLKSQTKPHNIGNSRGTSKSKPEDVNEKHAHFSEPEGIGNRLETGSKSSSKDAKSLNVETVVRNNDPSSDFCKNPTRKRELLTARLILQKEQLLNPPRIKNPGSLWRAKQSQNSVSSSTSTVLNETTPRYQDVFGGHHPGLHRGNELLPDISRHDRNKQFFPENPTRDPIHVGPRVNCSTVHRAPPLSRGKNYHVFFSYRNVEPDITWARMVIDKLESPPHNYKCCFAHRDFVPGVAVINNIEIAIKESLRVVVVLTEQYIGSYWCEYESKIMRTPECKACIIPLQLNNCPIPISLQDLSCIPVSQYNDKWWETLLMALKGKIPHLPLSKKDHVFLFHGDSDEEMVRVEKLMSALQLSKHGFRCTSKGTDFLSGQTIHENVDKNVQNAVVTIFALSKHFSKHIWLTHWRRLRRQRVHIIPLMFDRFETPNELRDIVIFDARKEQDTWLPELIKQLIKYVNLEIEKQESEYNIKKRNYPK